jgi:hypothetical protein
MYRQMLNLKSIIMKNVIWIIPIIIILGLILACSCGTFPYAPTHIEEFYQTEFGEPISKVTNMIWYADFGDDAISWVMYIWTDSAKTVPKPPNVIKLEKKEKGHYMPPY